MKKLLLANRRLRETVKHYAKTHSIVVLLVFLATAGVSVYYWSSVRESVHNDFNRLYNRQVHGMQQSITSQLETYVNFLRSGAGLFTVSNNVNQTSWNQFYGPYDVKRDYPAVQGIGFSRYLTSADVAGYVADMIADGGPADFHISPGGDRPIYVVATYGAKYSNTPGRSTGFDLYTDPVRRVTMDKAAANGTPVISDKVFLLNDTQKRNPAFIIYLPVYKGGQPVDTSTERQSSLYGFVYVSIDMRKMFGSILDTNQNPNFAARIADKDQPSAVAYQTANYHSIIAQNGSQQHTADLTLYGHTWRITYLGSPKLISAGERQLPAQAIWRGLFLSFFFAGLVWYLITNRERKFMQMKQAEVQMAKDDLLSLASHQLRTPATVVKQYVGMLLQGYGGDVTRQQHDMLDRAYESNERQLDIINQLLYVARLDAGRIHLRREAVDVSAMLRSVTEDQAKQMESRRQKLNCQLRRQPRLVDADPHYLRMVLDNLMSNAVKYTPDGGSISVKLAAKSKDGLLDIIISDTGVGIPSSELPAIFEKFTRLENDLSNDVNGSGVGLYLTRQIIDLHGGSISVDSEPNKGSTFTVSLPLSDATAASAPLAINQ